MSKVRQKIEKAKALRDAGRCWCPCVNDDIPNAERLLGEKKAGAANSVITAALKRCDGGLEADGSFRPDLPPAIRPVELPQIDLSSIKLPELPKMEV